MLKISSLFGMSTSWKHSLIQHLLCHQISMNVLTRRQWRVLVTRNASIRQVVSSASVQRATSWHKTKDFAKVGNGLIDSHSCTGVA